MSSALVLYGTIWIFLISFACGSSEGVFDKIKAGLQNAKNYIETARDIADLVSKSLRPKIPPKKRGDEADFSEEYVKKDYEPTHLVSTFFRLLGLDSKKVTAVAVNSFIFFAQMISELFKLTPKVQRANTINEETNPLDPIQLMIDSENEKVQNLLKKAKDTDLPNQLIEHADSFDSSCIKLLLCKTSPFIWAAQNSLEASKKNNHHDITLWLPSKEKFEEYADECEDKHTDCELNFAL
ncbi:uncharacterized protein LOC107980658 [Nasonia vitripennis]|uniref:Uncharacterized protein n=1 Tax=Nasonia vitripennis TaxID=7425 RepID=A0A7M7Q7Q6_NASVI|nr:uncharacterized protein LOC107980658 [Nasonia vitripennis]